MFPDYEELSSRLGDEAINGGRTILKWNIMNWFAINDPLIMSAEALERAMTILYLQCLPLIWTRISS